MNYVELQDVYNDYMDKCHSYADKVVVTEFVMNPPSLEEMKEIIARQPDGGKFKDRCETIIRHQFSNYDVMIRSLPAPACADRFRYMVGQTIRTFVRDHYRRVVYEYC